MKIWLLERIDSADYEETEGMVIAASNESRAREIANENVDSDFEELIWNDVEKVTCREITENETEGVILIDYNQG